MTRLSRLAWSAASLVLFVTAAAAFAPSSGVPSDSGVAAVSMGRIADQLGVKIVGRIEENFAVGTGFTGSLAEPAKLAEFGIKDMGVGARVAVVRVAPERVLVEADELEPLRRASVRLRLNADGTLSRM